MNVHTTITAPLGELLLTGTVSPEAKYGIRLTSLSMPGQRGAVVPGPDSVADPAAFAPVIEKIEAYFAGEPVGFDVDHTVSGTVFQERVWAALDDIPYGTTTTYGALAETLGVPRAEVRALGAAIGANPLLLVRPCHRVIGADGAMRGYAAGVDRKVALLTLEGALAPTLI
ncbi:methylated-DNA--[protein]-cysteine S-methyltransferase [Phytomonospora endophytica]|uniref:methylated-DNA--[protein]-cysteine S-methyltransferase n=1 Tax=Phytomonospora endophytica TaxID=714109 RepID=A0A841FLJ7_9ACTN|nr:methylated-DNA--[protein]-cysteine S-methyltransferase [Phytomonospora endophytica]MBB6035793.1 methylated-DNA-[protein]-cysteine S-methyltransferase [Phytomonospora endophytica]GIG69536.1 methylated-DNA--protein-cysteine methyltransferase [Phytomonospora endophytica]